jgi:hypothetical protein
LTYQNSYHISCHSTCQRAATRGRRRSSNLHVHADRGLAISRGKKVEFIELFEPTTQQGYEQAIYLAPGPFKL